MSKSFFKILIFLIVSFSFNLKMTASEKTIIKSKDWLISTPIKVSYPIFSDSLNNNGEKFEDNNILSYEYFDFSNYSPQIDANIPWSNETWKIINSNQNDQYVLDNLNSEILYLATYLSTDRWLKSTLKVKANFDFEIYLNDNKLGIFNLKDGKSEVNKEITLLKGKHKLVLKAYAKDNQSPKFNAYIETDSIYVNSNIKFENNPKRGMNIYDIMNGIKLRNASISFDGKYALISYSQNYSENDSRSWYDIVDLSNNKRIQTLPIEQVSSIKWLPKSNKLSYIIKEDKKSSIYLADILTNNTELVISQIEDFGGYEWADDESRIIYMKNHKPKPNEGTLNRIAELEDRQPWWRNRSYLFEYNLGSKISRRLTWGYLSTSLQDISSDGKKILFSTEKPQYETRQYASQDMFILNLENMEINEVWTNKTFPCSAKFSPDDKKLLVFGGPSAFGKVGENLPDGRIPNNYDTQAYLFNIDNKEVKAITREFNPKINSGFWNQNQNRIYFDSQDKSYNRLYYYDITKDKFEKVNTVFDISSSFSFAENSNIALYIGEGMHTPKRLLKINLDNFVSSEIANPEKNNYINVKFGESKNWDFISENNDTIIGRIYYPLDFDPEKKYPSIVYYYGGTNPVTRTFGGRYPFNLFAAQGYVVYVLQPSGATGFGQEFSSRHVNNWGVTVADEIINATKYFLQQNSFCDTNKVGCIGASYGGFMTMLLQTRTDIFAAAISHAGISSISSYWGEGFWGYLYSSEATAESFPWNNKDLYIEQSPLFNADKVKNPILLLHGDSDTNVPVGESIQFFTALKLLGKPVELVTIKDTDHHVISYKHRVEWNNAIFAWYDYWLKGEKEWWESIFPKANY